MNKPLLFCIFFALTAAGLSAAVLPNIKDNSVSGKPEIRSGLAYFEGTERLFTGMLEHRPEFGFLTRTTYVNGQKNGPERIYFDNGSLLSETHYRNNERHGYNRSWSESGILVLEESFRRGLRFGWRREYGARFGTLQFEQHYYDDQPNGMYREFNRAGTLITEGYYNHAGLKDNFENFYLDDGSIILSNLYRNGTIIMTRQPNADGQRITITRSKPVNHYMCGTTGIAIASSRNEEHHAFNVENDAYYIKRPNAPPYPAQRGSGI